MFNFLKSDMKTHSAMLLLYSHSVTLPQSAFALFSTFTFSTRLLLNYVQLYFPAMVLRYW